MIENLTSQVASLKRELEILRTAGSGLEPLIRSRTRSEVWTRIEAENQDNMRLLLCMFPALPVGARRKHERIQNAYYPAEADMYTPFVSPVLSILDENQVGNNLGAQVIDTHNKFFGGVYTPDGAIAVGDRLNVDGALLYMAIELKHTSKHPVVSEFKEMKKGNMKRLFPLEKCGVTMEVKRSSDDSKIEDIVHEVKMMKKIAAWGGTETLVRLAYNSRLMDELGVMPVGTRIQPKSLTQSMIQTIFNDTLSAIKWLHSKDVLHRDIRIENVGIYNERARVIDRSSALQLPSPPGDKYLGSYLCCPHELIADFDLPYEPKKSHDLLAFVVMATLLAFPNSLPVLMSKNVASLGKNSERLKWFWMELKQSPVRGSFVDAAEEGKPELLARIVEVFVLLLVTITSSIFQRSIFSCS